MKTLISEKKCVVNLVLSLKLLKSTVNFGLPLHTSCVILHILAAQLSMKCEGWHFWSMNVWR